MELHVQVISCHSGVGRLPATAEVSCEFVNLQDVTTREFIAFDVLRQKGGDVHAVFVALDVFHQHINPLVVAVDEKLAIAASWGVTVQFFTQLENHSIAHQCLVRVWAMKDPIIFFRHAEQRYVVVLTFCVLGFQRIRLLRKHLR